MRLDPRCLLSAGSYHMVASWIISSTWFTGFCLERLSYGSVGTALMLVQLLELTCCSSSLYDNHDCDCIRNGQLDGFWKPFTAITLIWLESVPVLYAACWGHSSSEVCYPCWSIHDRNFMFTCQLYLHYVH